MTSTETTTPESTGRNEPCPCGSGKKFKRCHGVDAPGKVAAAPAASSGAPPAPGVDPSKFDPAMMQQMAAMIQKLPKGQLQKLQALMRKAMLGKDVTQEAQELESQLPVEFQSLMKQFAVQAEAQEKAAPKAADAPSEPSRFKKAWGKLFGK